MLSLALQGEQADDADVRGGSAVVGLGLDPIDVPPGSDLAVLAHFFSSSSGIFLFFMICCETVYHKNHQNAMDKSL